MNNNLYYNPKRLRKIKNKRSCRTMKIWGWILTAVGGMSVLGNLGALFSGGGVSPVLDSLIVLIPGLVLLWLAKRQVTKWDRYDALIDERGNTSIPLIAQRMKLPEKTVYADLQKMISNDFFIGPNFNISPVIDAERELLVMTVGGRPLEPLPKAQEEAKATEAPKEKPAEQPGEGNWQDEEDIADAQWKEEPPIRIQLTDLEMIQDAIARISDVDVRNSLYGLEGSLRRIDERVQEEPELKKKSSVRNMYKYYVPQVMELIRAYQSESTTEEAKAQIRDALRVSAGAFGSIEADLLERDQMDMEVDIEVLRRMFAQDGLLREASGRTAGQGAQQARPAQQAQQARQDEGPRPAKTVNWSAQPGGTVQRQQSPWVAGTVQPQQQAGTVQSQQAPQPQQHAGQPQQQAGTVPQQQQAGTVRPQPQQQPAAKPKPMPQASPR